MPYKPTLFVASSSKEESVIVAEKLIELIKRQKHAYVKFWKDLGVFSPGNTTMADLIKLSSSCDIGIFIFNKDDDGKIENRDVFYTRGNVQIEYGLFVSKVGLNRSIILVPQDSTDLELPSDLKGITYVSYDPQCGEKALFETVSKIDRVIKDLQSEKNAYHYFDKFYLKEEPKLLDGDKIDYDRCIKLLLFMFESQNFKEFRALDLAFNRWRELNNERGGENQIKNYSKEIINSVQQLYIKGNCLNFRRLFVISTKEPLTKEDFEVLRIIQKAENDAKRIRLNKTKNTNKSHEILESRILYIEPHEFRLKLRSLNDFALFTSDISEFSIVETSLDSPLNTNVKPHCITVTNRISNNERKIFFDEVWQNNSISIEEFIDRFTQEDKSQTVLKSFKELFNSYSNKLSTFQSVSLIVETAYVELFRDNSTNRHFHVDRAFDLIKLLNSTPLLNENILLCTFINDFKEKLDTLNCFELCDAIDTNDDPQLKKNIVREYRNRNLFYVDENSVETYYMTETRNRAVKTIRSILDDSAQNNQIILKQKGENISEVILKSIGNNDFYLGYQNESTIIPNCVLLMAQHYFDIFSTSFKKNSLQKDFWIFDFNVPHEENSVRNGADAAVLLFSWPKGITLNIINFNFNDGGSGGFYRSGPFNF